MISRIRSQSFVFISIIVSICCAVGAYLFYIKSSPKFQGPFLLIGSVLLVLSVGLGGYGYLQFDKGLNRVREKLVIPEKTEKINIPFRVWVLSGSYLASLLFYWMSGENWIVHLLWIGAIGLLLSLVWNEVFGEIKGYFGEKKRERYTELGLVAILTLVAFYLRFWLLPTIPNGIDGDVASVGLQAQDIIHQPIANWFGVGWSQLSMLYFQAAALSMRIFGDNPPGLMTGSVITGALCIPAVYLLGKELFGRTAAFFAALFLAFSYTDIHFSRTVFTEGSCLFLVLILFTLFRGLHTGKKEWFAFSGLFLGIGLFAYDSIRITPVLLVLIFAWVLLWNRKNVISQARNWMIFAGGSLVGFGPQLVFAFTKNQDFLGRATEVTILSPKVSEHLFDKYHVSGLGPMLLMQVKRTLSTFISLGDSGTLFRFNGPIVNGLIVCLLIIGLGIALVKIKEAKYFSLLLWIGAGLFFGGVMTNDPPYWSHLSIIIPGVMVAAGMGVGCIERVLVGFVERSQRMILSISFCLLAIISLVSSWQGYLVFASGNADTRLNVSRYLDTLPAEYNVYMISDRIWLRDREFQFFNHGIKGVDLVDDQNDPIQLPTLDKPAIFIVTTDHDQDLAALERAYPRGKARVSNTIDGYKEFTVFTVLPPGYTPPAPRPRNFVQNSAQLIWALFALLLATAILWTGYSLAGFPTVKLPARFRRSSKQTAKEVTIPMKQTIIDAAIPSIRNEVQTAGPVLIDRQPSMASPANFAPSRPEPSPWLVVSAATVLTSIFALMQYLLEGLRGRSPRQSSSRSIDERSSQSTRQGVELRNSSRSSINWLAISSLFSTVTSMILLVRLWGQEKTLQSIRANPPLVESKPEIAAETAPNPPQVQAAIRPTPAPEISHAAKRAVAFNTSTGSDDQPPALRKLKMRFPSAKLLARVITEEPASDAPIDQSRAVSWRSWLFIGPMLSIIAVFFGQMVLDVNVQDGIGFSFASLAEMNEETRVLIGLGILIVGMVLWMLAFPKDSYPVEKSLDPDGKQKPENPLTVFLSVDFDQPFSLASLSALACWAGIVCCLLSVFNFRASGENSLVRLAWILGVVFFVLSQVLGWVRAAREQDGSVHMRLPGMRALTAIGVILIAGFVLRFYRLATLPSDFHGDMASHGLMARDILNGTWTTLFHDAWANIPTLAFIPSAISLTLFGNNLFGLQMTSVIEGMICLLSVYLLTLRLFGRQRIALTATAILAINIPFIHFSRIAEYIDPWAFILPGLYFAIGGIRSGKSYSYGIAGVLLGFGLQMYYSGRVSLVILAGLFVSLFLFERDWFRRNWMNFAWIAVGVLIAIGPSLIFFGDNVAALNERSREVWLFTPDVMTHMLGRYGVATPVAVVFEQLVRSLLMFNHSIDSSTQFGFPHPMFDSLLAPIVVLGIAFTIRYWKKWNSVLLLMWISSMMVIGSTLTVDAPFWPRLVGILPAASIAAALGIEWIYKWVGRWPKPVPTAVLNIFLIGVFILVGWKDWTLYSQTVNNNARPPARVGRYLSGLPTEVTACNFLNPFELKVRETYFLAWPRQVVDIPEENGGFDLSACPGAPVVWILSKDHMDQLDRIRAAYPGGVLEDHFEANGTYVFTSYLVENPPASSQ
jgi:4-amino-4-deoxy-L-arabinose transferase-like glycosyltransferase